MLRSSTLLLLSLIGAATIAVEPQHVLLIDSFGPEFAPFNAFSGSFRTELAQQSTQPVDFYEVSLESARFRDETQEAPFVDYLHALVSDRHIDLIVPIGGPAARFAQRYRQHLFSNVPMLLAAVDERHLDMATLSSKDTVVAVRNDPARVLEHMLHLFPKTTNVVVIIGNSPLEKFWLEELRGEVRPFRDRARFTWANEWSFPEMLNRCSALPPNSAVFYVVFSVDVEGVPHLELRALSQLHAVANAPLFGLHDTQLGHGIVGGPLMKIGELSQATAAVAARILGGEEPGSFRLPPQEPGTPEYDWRELQRWGVREARLPAGSVIRFRQPSAWQLYKWRILGVTSLALLEAALIVLLLANLVQRRRAQLALRTSEERLAVATTAGDIGIWVWDMGNGSIWASKQLRRMFGFTMEVALRFENFLERIHPNDRAAAVGRLKVAAKTGTEYEGEFRVVLRDGSERWLAARGRLETNTLAKPARMLGATVDVTERKRVEEASRNLSGRLLRAQEEERARLARELHDDITQRLARLAIDVGRSEQGTSELPPAEAARQVREGLVRLSEDVHALSYRLHPSMLDDLGLVEALKAECDRFSKMESVATEVKLSDVPRLLPAETAIGLFRVAQEALRNIARYARASAVVVTARQMDGGLQLAVQDNGVGFDPSLKRERFSLGLASMRERLRLLEGELDIESAPGHGTTIIAWLPLQKPEIKN